MVPRGFPLGRQREALKALAVRQLSPLSPLLDAVLRNVIRPRVQRLTTRLEQLSERFPVLASVVQRSSRIRGLWSDEPTAINDAPNSAPPPRGVGWTMSPSRALEMLRDEDDFQARAHAVLDLTDAPGPHVTSALVTALHDPAVEVAVAAVQALSKRGDDSARAPLLSIIGRRDHYLHPATRAAAISALGASLRREEHDAILQAVRDEDAEVSMAAIAVIADQLPEHASEHLIPVLQDASGYFLPVVRLSAAHGLARARAMSADRARALCVGELDSSVASVLSRVAAGTAPS